MAVVVVADEENVQRLNERDPIDIDIKKFGPPFADLKIARLLICIEDEAGIKKIGELKAKNDITGLIDHVLRGWKFRPERGDSDKPYERMTEP